MKFEPIIEQENGRQSITGYQLIPQNDEDLLQLAAIIDQQITLKPKGIVYTTDLNQAKTISNITLKLSKVIQL